MRIAAQALPSSPWLCPNQAPYDRIDPYPAPPPPPPAIQPQPREKTFLALFFTRLNVDLVHSKLRTEKLIMFTVNDMNLNIYSCLLEFSLRI